MSLPGEDVVRDALTRVMDPEAGMNIVDLGLIYGIEVADTSVRIELTMTSAACPMADMIMEEVRAAAASVLPAGIPVEVDLVWDPPWTPDRMSGFAREHFGWSFG